jgi:Zn-dependent protease
MMDHEVLMMEALDGTISERDRARLDAYLAAHPDERALFAAMQSVDDALSSAPLATPTPALSRNIMQVTRTLPIARPLRSGPLAFFVGANAMFMMLIWVGALAALTFAALNVVPNWVFDGLAQVLRNIADAFGILGKGARVLVRQPATWAVASSCVVIVALWLGVMARVMRSNTPRLAQR